MLEVVITWGTDPFRPRPANEFREPPGVAPVADRSWAGSGDDFETAIAH